MYRFAYHFSRIIARYFGKPIQRTIILFIVFFRFIFFGWYDTNDYLSRIGKNHVIFLLRLFGAKIGKNCDIESGIRFHNCINYSNLIVGNNCHIGKDCFFDLRDKIIIGDNVVISMKVTVITHQDINKSELKRLFPASSGKVNIQDNCYIGACSTILMNTTVHCNSIVGASSLVISDINEDSVYGGVPAKYIKSIYGV